jgi:chromate transporter
VLLRLFVSFLLVGFGAYGGGTATISLIYHELVTKRHWLTDVQMNRLITLAEMTPGPIAVNAATFTGFQMNGFWGAAVATFAVILPSLSMLIAFLLFYKRYLNRWIRSADRDRILQALRPGILALILVAIWIFGRTAISGVVDLAIAAACLAVLVATKKVHPLLLILASGLIGLVLYRL